MKRNLSSQAIRAMAIGMAVTLGSATAVSGVVTGTVVNVYAAATGAHKDNIKEGTTITKEGSNAKIELIRKNDSNTSFGGTANKTEGFKLKKGSNVIFTGSGDKGNLVVTNEKITITIPLDDLSGKLVGNDNDLSISYSKLGTSDVKIDTSNATFQSGVSLEITDIPVANSTVDTTAPTLTGATAVYKSEGGKFKVEITLNSDTLEVLGEKQSTDKFTFAPASSGANGNETKDAQLSAYEVSQDGKLILTLNKALVDGKYTVTYASQDNAIKDAAGNALVQTSNNKVDFTVTAAPPVANAPVIKSNAKYAEDTKTITLTSDKDLNDKTEVNKDTHGFVVKNSKKQEQEIKQVTVKGKEITIELNGKDALVGDTYTIGYTKKDRAEFVVAKDGGKLDTNENLATFKVNAAVKPPAQGNLTATTNVGTYTFEKVSGGVALVKFESIVTKVSQATNKFENGVFTDDTNTSYNLVQIGNGSALTTLTDDALKGHTTNVTEIKEKAFENNINVTTLSFPKVTIVGANAFKGATALATIDLGSQATKTTVAYDAFTGAKAITTVKTNEASKTAVETVAKKGSPNVKVDVSISQDKYNAKDAKIEKDKFYQTEDGLLFKGLETKNSLTFMGKKEFKAPTQANTLNGSEQKPYFVTYVEGKVTLQSEKGGDAKPPVEKDVFTANVRGNTLTFKKLTDNNGSNGTVALTNVAKTTSRATSTGQLANGELTVGAEKYNLTQLGNGTESLGNFESSVLEGNLGNVITVKSNAFKDNNIITTISLPAVEKIEANAFDGTASLSKLDLGSKDVTIIQDAFKNAGNGSLKVETDSENTKNNINNNGGNGNIGVENRAPEVVLAEVTKENSDYILTLTLSEKVFATTSEKADFTVQSGKESNLVNNDVKKIEIGNNKGDAKNTIKLTLTNPVKKGEKVTFKYEKNVADDKQIKDTDAISAKTLESFDVNKINVVNSIQEDVIQTTPITIKESDSKVNTKTVTIVTNENIIDNSKQQLATTNGFVVKKGGSQANIEKVEITANNTIKLTLQDAVTDNDEVKFEYTGGNSEFKANDGNTIANISETAALTNETTNVAPTISGGTVDKSQKIITLTASENLKVMSISSDFGFVVKNGSGDVPLTVTKVEVKDANKDRVEITVSDDLTSISTLKVSYTKPKDSNQIKDSKDLALENIDAGSPIEINATRAFIAQRDSDFAVIALAADTVEVVNGDVTGITNVKDATEEQINSILKGGKLTNIYNGAFKYAAKDLKLDFSKVNISNLNIESGAFTGAQNLNITGVAGNDVEKLANKIGSSSDIKINNKTTQEIIKDNSNSGNGGSGSGGGSSSGGSGGGSGANIGTITNKKPNTEETTSQGNKNETVVENKQLNFDVIKLPSVEGEAKVFGDVSANHWAKSYIDKLSTARIINGSNGMFNPNGQTKRADVTVMLVNLLGLTPEANNKFADVNASAYYAPYVGTASTYGIVNGSNGMFNPQGVISRQDTMVMIAQILKGLNLNVNADTTALSQFGDASKVSAYANESVAILVNSGIIAGNNGKLNPTAPVTRAEMATIMSKLYDVLASANK